MAFQQIIHTVNQQMFAALNVCELAYQNISLLLINVRSLSNLIFKIQLVPETRQQDLQMFACY